MSEINWEKMDGLIPAVVQDDQNGRVLMLGYMNQESFDLTIRTGCVTFYSRSRNVLWRKGETSGNVLHFKSYAVDCDGDTLLVMATPDGPTCHTGAVSCFGELNFELGFLTTLEDLIDQRYNAERTDSYVAHLKAKGLPKIAQKVGEEGVETALAAILPSIEDFENEAADLLFHLMVLLREKNSSLSNVVKILQQRMHK